jgi:hypothetical protein
MAYVVIGWPDIQQYMGIPGFEENSYLVNDEKGVEDFGSSAYFVDEDWLENIGKEDDVDVDDVVSDCLHTLEDGEEYEFETPIKLSENRVAKKFWVDDGNEDVRVEIWLTYPYEIWREDAFLSSMEQEDAVKVAKAIDTYWD